MLTFFQGMRKIERGMGKSECTTGQESRKRTNRKKVINSLTCRLAQLQHTIAAVLCNSSHPWSQDPSSWIRKDSCTILILRTLRSAARAAPTHAMIITSICCILSLFLLVPASSESWNDVRKYPFHMDGEYAAIMIVTVIASCNCNEWTDSER